MSVSCQLAVQTSALERRADKRETDKLKKCEYNTVHRQIEFDGVIRRYQLGALCGALNTGPGLVHE